MEILKCILIFLICGIPTAVVCYFLIKSAKMKPDYGNYIPKAGDISGSAIEIIDCKNR